MKGRIRQCSPSTWQISYSLPHDVLEKHRIKAQTIRDRLAQWMRGALPAGPRAELVSAWASPLGNTPRLVLADATAASSTPLCAHPPARPQCGQGCRTALRQATPPWADIFCL